MLRRLEGGCCSMLGRRAIACTRSIVTAKRTTTMTSVRTVSERVIVVKAPRAPSSVMSAIADEGERATCGQVGGRVGGCVSACQSVVRASVVRVSVTCNGRAVGVVARAGMLAAVCEAGRVGGVCGVRRRRGVLRARREASNHHRRRLLNLRRLAGCEWEVGCGKVEAASHQPVRHEHQRRQQHQCRLDRALHVAQQKFGAGREPDEAHRVIVDEVGEAGAIVVREHPEHARPGGSTSDEVAGD